MRCCTASGQMCPIFARLKGLDDRSRICYLVGYKYTGGGYRVWAPKHCAVVESRDTTFLDVLSWPNPPTTTGGAVSTDSPTVGC